MGHLVNKARLRFSSLDCLVWWSHVFLTMPAFTGPCTVRCAPSPSLHPPAAARLSVLCRRCPGVGRFFPGPSRQPPQSCTVGREGGRACVAPRRWGRGCKRGRRGKEA